MSRLLPLVFLAALATPALALEPEVVTTASGAGAPPTVAQQIDDYLKTSPAAALPKDDASGVTSGAEEPRKIHGVVDVSAGSGGYHSAFVASEIPVGKTGSVTIAVGQTHFGNRFSGGYYPGGYYPGGQSLALGLSLDSTLNSSDCRRAQAADGDLDSRFDPRSVAGRPAACRTLAAPTLPY